MTMVIDGSNGLTFPAGSTQVQAGNFQTMVNRIINPRMEIDQRNAGASVTPTNDAYTLDRWQVNISDNSKFTIQQSSTAPAGFKNSLLVTSSSAFSLAAGSYFVLDQKIEGFNTADLNFGTANAQTVTLSFWVRSSLTGTFGGVLRNSAENRSYPFTYTISAANTWEQKTITIAGDTSGTWISATNGVGLYVGFGLGVGTTYSGTAGAWAGATYASATGATSVVSTNGATWYITGVDLRVGSYTVVPQDFRSYGTELALCQRYFQRLGSLSGSFIAFGSGVVQSSTVANLYIKYTNSMRAAATLTTSNCAIWDSTLQAVTGIVNARYGTDSMNVELSVASGLTTGRGAVLLGNNSSVAYIELSAEL